jgi:membrane-associated phospholipid phosphatase
LISLKFSKHLPNKTNIHTMMLRLLPLLAFLGCISASSAAGADDDDRSTRRIADKTSPSMIRERMVETDRPIRIDDIRFNKVPPIAYTNDTWYVVPSADYPLGVHTNVYPLLPSDYPIQGIKAEIMQRETMADSVITENPMDYDLFGETAASYMEFLKEPHMPSSDPTSPYWDELREVVDAQIARRAGADPSTLNRWPNTWQDYDLEEIALAVFNEYPASLQQVLIVNRLKTPPRILMDRTVLPFRSELDMVGTQLRIATLNTWSIEAVGAINFLLKWTYGVPRPEEVAWLIASGSIGVADGVPEDLVASIQSMNLPNATSFTAYPIGSPNHPSWPAMHAAGSSCSFWLPAVAKLTPEEYCEALRVDYAVAYARTVAGVHYQMDNLAGLNVGQEILKRKLPGYLAANYNSDPTVVSERLEKLSFDWKDFDPYNCTIANVPVGDRLNFDQ